jgi:molecular chaperone GrpE
MSTTNEDERIVDKRAAARPDPGDDLRAADHAGERPEGELEEEIATTDSALADALDKADTYYKNWQRSAADFVNFKRRVEQERGESARFASAALVINLLPVYDDLQRAVSTVDANLAGLNWVQGIIAIERKFTNLLNAMDVTEVDAEGQQFDPALHEAVARQPGEEGKILHVVQRGYKLGDKVIRPAMVIVGEGGAVGN